jgi:hypothetical protein
MAPLRRCFETKTQNSLIFQPLSGDSRIGSTTEQIVQSIVTPIN